jgi:hypothetical protein
MSITVRYGWVEREVVKLAVRMVSMKLLRGVLTEESTWHTTWYSSNDYEDLMMTSLLKAFRRAGELANNTRIQRRLNENKTKSVLLV